MTDILLIGGGHMGGAMATRWRAAGYDVAVVEPSPGRRTALQHKGIACHETLEDATPGDLVVLAIKPQQFAGAAPGIKSAIHRHAPLVVSVMAGIPLAMLKTLAPHVVRVMPNLPATIGESMSVVFAPTLEDAMRARVQKLFDAIGKTAWVEEEAQLHAVTAISGSGPAYLFALMEALAKAGIAQGLPSELVRQLVAQTIRGAALMAGDADPAILREQVTSKGGTTEAALQQFAEGGFEALVACAVSAAVERSHTLKK